MNQVNTSVCFLLAVCMIANLSVCVEGARIIVDL